MFCWKGRNVHIGTCLGVAHVSTCFLEIHICTTTIIADIKSLLTETVIYLYYLPDFTVAANNLSKRK